MKNKQITLENYETIQYESLTDREKLIYRAGEKAGTANTSFQAAMGVMIGVALVVVFIVLLT